MTRTAIVTGASRVHGIGAAIALALAKEGYRIALHCRSEESFEKGGREVLEACRALGAEAEPFFADLSDFDRTGEMMKEIHARFGTVDVLVNNAGITRDGLLARMKESQFDEVIASNLKSTFNMMRAASPIMMKQRSGRIINITSVVGLYGNAGQVNYAASKAGIVGMTLSAAKELGGRGITVNAVAPGAVATDMTASLPDSVREAMVNAIALKRFAKPEEIASAVSFLASEGASYITGQTIVVDGGMSI